MPTSNTVSVVRVPGDYVVFANHGGVVIDVNNTTSNVRPAMTGTVSIYGNLDVIGSTTYIESTNTNILDNMIYLNANETNNYVSQGTSGIAISRGELSTATAATMLYNDTLYWSESNVQNNRGVWEFKVSNILGAIQVAAVRSGGLGNNLNFLGQENALGVLNVTGTTNYEDQVVAYGDDAIPNKKYVDSRNPYGLEETRKLRVGFSTVEIRDPSVVNTDPYWQLSPKIFATLGTSTNVVFKLENREALIQGLTINDTEIRVEDNRNSVHLYLTPFSNTGTIVANAPLSLKFVNKPSAEARTTKVYSTSTIGGGGTGLYFVNTQNTDELVSRKRAIIYGIIF